MTREASASQGRSPHPSPPSPGPKAGTPSRSERRIARSGEGAWRPGRGVSSCAPSVIFLMAFLGRPACPGTPALGPQARAPGPASAHPGSRPHRSPPSPAGPAPPTARRGPASPFKSPRQFPVLLDTNLPSSHNSGNQAVISLVSLNLVRPRKPGPSESRSAPHSACSAVLLGVSWRACTHRGKPQAALSNPRPVFPSPRFMSRQSWRLGLTVSSTRTPPALPSALSQHSASSAPFVASVQAGPVSFIR